MGSMLQTQGECSGGVINATVTVVANVVNKSSYSTSFDALKRKKANDGLNVRMSFDHDSRRPFTTRLQQFVAMKPGYIKMSIF